MSEQRQATEKAVTADATCKLTGGEQYRGATVIPSRCRDGPRIGGAVMMAASEVSSDYPLSYVADAKWVGYCRLEISVEILQRRSKINVLGHSHAAEKSC